VKTQNYFPSMPKVKSRKATKIGNLTYLTTKAFQTAEEPKRE